MQRRYWEEGQGIFSMSKKGRAHQHLKQKTQTVTPFEKHQKETLQRVS